MLNTTQKHIIKRQVLEVTIPVSAQADDMHKEISRIQHRYLHAIIDKCLDAVNDDKQIRRIESLELDLGHLDSNNLQQELIEKFTQQFPIALAQQCTQIQGQSKIELNAGQRSHIELLTEFVMTGTLPWWADSNNKEIITECVDKLIASSLSSLFKFLQTLSKQPNALDRLINHLDDSQLSAFVKINDRNRSYVQYFAEKLYAARTLLCSESKVQFRKIVWRAVLTVFGATVEVNKRADSLEFIQNVLEILSIKLGLVPINLVKIISSIKETSSKALEADVGKALSGLSVSTITKTYQRQLLEFSNKINASKLSADKIDFLIGTVFNLLPKSIGQKHRELLELYFLSILHSKDCSEVVEVLVNNLNEALLEKFIRALDSTLRETDLDVKLDSKTEHNFSDSDDVYISNSGLVVLAPYLGHFFTHLGLLADGKFNSEADQLRGAGLLQYIAMEEVSPGEFMLPLNKILCGLDPSVVYEFGDPITDVEIGQCGQLLDAIISNAPILKNMSHDGLRNSFILRKGMLSADQNIWLLRVEKATHDIVLDKLPWQFSTIKQPWMNALLQVEWL